MIPYMVLNISVVMLAMIFNQSKRNNIHSYNVKTRIYLIITGISLTLFSGLRGDFTSDYRGYARLFDFYNSFSFREMLNHSFGQEWGYVLLNRLIGLFTNNSMFIMLITSLIIVVLFFKEIKRESVYIWLSVFLFITIGQYYTSFNLIRQILSTAIVFASSRYLYDRKLFKYLLLVLIASTFHLTALIMIPAYFMLNFRFNMKKLLLSLVLFSIIMLYIDNIIFAIQQYINIYQHYTATSYGMMGFNYKNVALQIAVLGFVLINYRSINRNSEKANVWLNAVLFYAFFTSMGLKVQMIERLSHFFAPYVLLLIPHIISNIKSKELRSLYFYVIVVVSLLYSYLAYNGTGFNPYYTIFSSY